MSRFSPPEPLNRDHDLLGFDSGKPPLDSFLKQHALDKQNAKLSRTYVVAAEGHVVAYYTLAHLTVLQEETPKKFGRGMPSSIPVMLMARLAVDLRHQGQGLGRSLFTDAVRRTWAVMESGAAPVRLFVVDAKDEEARTFYERFDLVSSPDNPMRLFLSYKTLRLLFGEEADQDGSE
jgi:GNAT superfamily N-acetyltransferase